jgi:hypothetical protein
MTGASSIFLFMAAMKDVTPFLLHVLLPSSIDKRHLLPPVDRIVQTLGQFLHCVGVACLLLFWTAPISFESVPFGLEDWYLFPSFLAGTSVAVLLYQHRQKRRLGNGLFVFGLFVAVISIFLDGSMCLLLGSVYLDAFTASNGIFLACDLCFLGLYVRLLNAKRCDKMSPGNKNKVT